MAQEQTQKQLFLAFEELLNKAIDENKISNWKINIFNNRKSNIYIESDYKIESILNSQRKEFVFTVYKEFENDVGQSSFTLSEADDVKKFELELEDAIFICSQARSKKYSLPSKDDKIVDDSKIDYDIFYNKGFFDDFKSDNLNIFFAEKLKLFKDIVEKSQTKETFIRLNSFECLNSISEVSIKTSKNIDKGYKRNSSYMEFVLTGIDMIVGKETEYIVYKSVSDIYNFNFEEFFSESIQYAIDKLREETIGNFKGKVILSGSALKDFFVPDLTMNSVVGHALARLKFLGITNYEKGEEVIKSKLDKLFIYSNPLLENNSASSPYDSDGISARKTCIVKESRFESFLASKQYADYLGIEATGPVGSIEVGEGKKSETEFYADNDEMIEIVSFASFVPDMISGDFSSEIRLGYKIKNGKKSSFKGGLFTGNIFKILEEVELSKEKTMDAGYFGPKTVKFYKGEIVGL